MRCIFCKQDSSKTKSVEHIIPESLGNKTSVLPKGFVCDRCNNYFAHEVEKPFMEQMNIQLLRFEESIPNKKNKIPSISGIFEGNKVTIHKKIANDQAFFNIDVSQELAEKLINRDKCFQLILPAFNEEILPEQNSITSRFVAKIALEALSIRIKDDEEWLEYLVNDPQFDAIREHARLGSTKKWPCSVRRIYSAHRLWDFGDHLYSQIVHEFDFLFINSSGEQVNHDYVQAELYFIIALWGIEFAINIGGPEIEGYEKWLTEHNGISPLYHGKNKLSNRTKYIY